MRKTVLYVAREEMSDADSSSKEIVDTLLRCEGLSHSAKRGRSVKYPSSVERLSRCAAMVTLGF